MLVLIIMLVTTTNVSALDLTSSNNSIIPEDVIQTFKNSLNTAHFNYLSYDCNINNVTRTCYFAYDKKGNYISITYTNETYNSQRIINKGQDNNININGLTYSYFDYSQIILILLSFIFVLFLTYKLIF